MMYMEHVPPMSVLTVAWTCVRHIHTNQHRAWQLSDN